MYHKNSHHLKIIFNLYIVNAFVFVDEVTSLEGVQMIMLFVFLVGCTADIL